MGAAVGGVALAGTAQVTFVADVENISSEESSVELASSGSLTANGLERAVFTVAVRDAHGNPVPGQTVLVEVGGGETEVVQPPGPTDAAGEVTAEVASTQAGTKTVDLVVNPGPDELFLPAALTLEFLGDPATVSAERIQVEFEPVGPLVADGVTAYAIAVTVWDALENPVPGQEVTVTAGGEANLLVQPPGPTGPDGRALASLASTAAEPKPIGVVVDTGLAEIVLEEALELVFTGDPANVDPAGSSFAVEPPGAVVADGLRVATLTVTVRDVHGNPVAGLPVEILATGGGNVLTQPPAPTDGGGMATATLASTVAGTKVLTAVVHVEGGSVVLDARPEVVFTADAGSVSPALSQVAVEPATGLLSDGEQSATVQVTVRDVHGNPVPGLEVAVSASGAGNALVQPAAPTGAGGVATASLASTAAGMKKVQAVVQSAAGPVTLDDAPLVEFVSDASSISGILSSVAVAPAEVVADGEAVATVTVTVRDANGNPVAGQVVELGATGTCNSIVQPAAPTGTDGVAVGTLASILAEAKDVFATVNPGEEGVEVVQRAAVTFFGDPANVSPGLSSVQAQPAEGLVADGEQVALVTVTVVDVNGNSIAGLPVALAASGSENVLTQPAAPTDAAGVATGGLATTCAETKVLTATVLGSAGPVAVSYTHLTLPTIYSV